jgi:genome maintenance exonuclease 1
MKTLQDDPSFVREELNVIDLDSLSLDGKRYYRTPDGRVYPSVTTVTSSTKKEFIEQWRARVGEKEADKISRRASSRGTDLHTMCEQYTLNNPNYRKGLMPTTLELFGKIKPFLDQHVEVIYANEIALFSHELKTAGRTDMFCRFMGMNTIVDFKTSTKPKEEKWIEDYFIQATTYAMMIEEMYAGEKKIFIPQLAIVIAVEETGAPGQLFVKQTNPYRNKVRKLFKEYHENHYPPVSYLFDNDKHTSSTV